MFVIIYSLGFVRVVLPIADRSCLELSSIFECLYNALRKQDFLALLILLVRVLFDTQLTVPLGDPSLKCFRRQFTLILDHILAVALISVD